MTRGRELALVAAILAAYLALFGRAVAYDYVWDDVQEIQHSPLFDGPLGAAMRATQADRIDPFLTRQPGVELAYDSYRPLLVASLWLEIRAWGRAPAPMHVANLVLGALAILVAYALARRWLGALALVPVAVFALHPMQAETIAYISGRGDLMAGLFALAASLAAVRGRSMLACLAFAASLFCKEACLGLPLAIAAVLVTTGELRRRWWLPAAMLGVAVAYLAVRAALIGTSSSLALGAAVVRLPGVWVQYVASALLPFDLSTERPYDPAYTAIGWVGFGLAAAGLAVWWTRRGPPRAAALSGLAWFAALLGPAAIAIATTRIASDRYAYLPVLGLALALTDAGARVARARPALRRAVILAAVVWGAMLAVVSWRQVPVWRDDEALDTNAIAMTPDAPTAYYRLGNVDAQAGRWDDAIAHFGRATELDPLAFHALDNLGVALMRMNRFVEAEAVLVRAVAASPPAVFRASYNLGVARLALGKREQACRDIRRALAINPAYAAALATARTSCP